MRRNYIKFSEKETARANYLKSKKKKWVEVKTDLNITSIGAVIISIASAAYQFGINFHQKIELMPIRQVQFFEENSILKFAAFFNYINNRSNSNGSIIASEEVIVIVGSTTIPYEWKSFSNYNNEGGRLKSSNSIEASAFTAKFGESTSHETTFLPSKSLSRTPNLRDFKALIGKIPKDGTIKVVLKYHIYGDTEVHQQECTIKVDDDLRGFLEKNSWVAPYCS